MINKIMLISEKAQKIASNSITARYPALFAAFDRITKAKRVREISRQEIRLTPLPSKPVSGAKRFKVRIPTSK